MAEAEDSRGNAEVEVQASEEESDASRESRSRGSGMTADAPLSAMTSSRSLRRSLDGE
jgi:hypothetical protein